MQAGPTVDTLAGLAGREKFLATLAAQLEAHAAAGRQLALHLVDIDRFRLVNDMLGEAQGDQFLRSVAERLLVLVENPDRLARIGDDEFAVLQQETGGARHAEIYARRIEDTLKDACAQIPRHARPGASIGVAVAPEHGQDAAALLHSASLALRAAKKAGGDTFRLYAREMEMGIETRLQMEKMLSEGLHQGWFELHFQPQYDLRSRRLTGFEALVRMNHPEEGELQPDAFLPAAEQSGLIQPLGEWIVREALTVASEWPQHLTLAINVSTAQFRHGDAAGTILSALASSGFDGARLHVEISEAILLDDTDSVRDQLKRLKRAGVTIVLDDFGIDSSRLQSLARSACDAVKIDRTLHRKGRRGAGDGEPGAQPHRRREIIRPAGPRGRRGARRAGALPDVERLSVRAGLPLRPPRAGARPWRHHLQGSAQGRVGCVAGAPESDRRDRLSVQVASIAASRMSR